MLNQSMIETILVALGLMGTQFFFDETQNPKLYIVEQHYGVQDSMYVLNKGVYFCPIYCEANHIHLTHEQSYNCSDVVCSHHKFNKLVSRVKLKKKKKGKPLPVKGVIAYDMDEIKQCTNK